MEVKLKLQKVKNEREKRAWSQEHLAEVAGLGLRTIQRIESVDSASLESIMAIASAFDTTVADLKKSKAQNNKVVSTPIRRVGLGAVVLAIVLTLTGQFVAGPIFAKDILLDYSISVENQGSENESAIEGLAQNFILSENSETVSVEFPKLMKLQVTPILNYSEGVPKEVKALKENQVFLMVKVYVEHDGQYELVSEPRIITDNNKQAFIQMKSDGNRLIKIALTPSIQEN